MPRGFRGPLLNSASPWASSKEQLAQLYASPYTGAVTVRTSLLNGWNHDDDVNQWTFYDARVNVAVPQRSPNANSSFNTLGYSPTSLPQYLAIIEAIVADSGKPPAKPFVVSVTGSPDDVVKCKNLISECASRTSIPLLMEINLSCPNILDMPPPAYSGESLRQFLFALQRDIVSRSETASIPIGLKTAPYTYHGQFRTLVDALAATAANNSTCPISFITATNTLGNSLLMDQPDASPEWSPTLASASGTGIGGIGGTAIHSLSLGNVRTLRVLLDKEPALKDIEIIGVGGVTDFLGFSRMKSAGASVVAIGTALGREGIDIFHRITSELQMGANAVGKHG